MFGELAFELIKELDRSPDGLPVFNVGIQNILRNVCIYKHSFHILQEELVRQVLKEINAVFDENHRDA